MKYKNLILDDENIIFGIFQKVANNSRLNRIDFENKIGKEYVELFYDEFTYEIDYIDFKRTILNLLNYLK